MVGTFGINRFFICESGTSVYGKTWVICKFSIVRREEIKSKECLGEGDVGIHFSGKLVWIHANLLAPSLYSIYIKNSSNSWLFIHLLYELGFYMSECYHSISLTLILHVLSF